MLDVGHWTDTGAKGFTDDARQGAEGHSAGLGAKGLSGARLGAGGFVTDPGVMG